MTFKKCPFQCQLIPKGIFHDVNSQKSERKLSTFIYVVVVSEGESNYKKNVK